MPIDEFRISVTVNAPLELVWQHLVDWKSQSNWMAPPLLLQALITDAIQELGLTLKRLLVLADLEFWMK